MISKSENIKLSSVTNILSSYLLKHLHEFETKTRKILKEMAIYLKFQIKFLIQFNYTKANIKNHLMEKAAAFFGFDIKEAGKISKSKRVRNKIKQIKSRLNRQLKEGRTIKSELNKRKKTDKKVKNIYRAPE